MLSKLILLLGALIATVIAFYCIDHNLSVVYPQKQSAQTPTQPVAQSSAPEAETLQKTAATESVGTEAAKEEQPAVQLADASLLYRAGEHATLTLHANEAEKETLTAKAAHICPAETCTQKLLFDDKTAHATWKEDILTVIESMQQAHVSDAKVEIQGKEIVVEGTFHDPETVTAVRNALQELERSGFHVTDRTHLAESEPQVQETKPVENETEPQPQKHIVIETAPQPLNTTQEKAESEETLAETPQTTVESTQAQINAILLENPIYFRKNSNELTLTSKQVLDRIIDIVNRTTEEIKSMRIAGHTDASGSAAYNKILSQRRAQSVRDYFISHHIKVPRIETVGYGEERPVTDNPYDKENRRVEITIHRKGE